MAKGLGFMHPNCLCTSGETEARASGRCRPGQEPRASLSSEVLDTSYYSLPGDLALNFTLPPSSWVEMGQAASLSEPQFLHPLNGDNNMPTSAVAGWIKEVNICNALRIAAIVL